jgi:hypothetical protein
MASVPRWAESGLIRADTRIAARIRALAAVIGRDMAAASSPVRMSASRCAAGDNGRPASDSW